MILTLQTQLQAANNREVLHLQRIKHLEEIHFIRDGKLPPDSRQIRIVNLPKDRVEEEPDPIGMSDVRVFDETADKKLIQESRDALKVARVAADITEEEDIEAQLDELAEEVGGIAKVAKAKTTPVADWKEQPA